MSNDLTFEGREVTNYRYAWQRIVEWMGSLYPPPYVNEDCPEACATEHECDQAGGPFTCPETGEQYGWCEGHYEFRPVYSTWNGRRSTYPTSFYVGPDGDQRCDDCHGETFSTCDSCYGEVYREDLHWHETNEEEYCDSCYSQHPERGGMEGTNEPVRTCSKCGTANVHLAMLTEHFHCDCEAHALLRQGQPVVLAHPLLKVPAKNGSIVRYARLTASRSVAA